MASTVEGTDAELIQAARTGDRAALEALLERHQSHIYRFGVKMCGDGEDAREVLQETLLAAARNLPSFREEASLTTWLYAIARSFCIKRRRKSRFAPAHEQSLEGGASGEAGRVADPGRGPDEALEARELQRRLDGAIDGLDPMYREVLVLRDVEGLTAPEVAEVVGIGVDAVKSRLHRARAMMRARLALDGSEAGEGTGAAPGCPDIVEMYSRELEGEISAELCASMEHHLAGCSRCRSRCDGMRRVLSVCAAAPLPAVPKEAQEAVRHAFAELRRTT